MAPGTASERLTREAYLAWERASETRNEYWDGEVVELGPQSRWHSLIVVNLLAGLANALARGPLIALGPAMRVGLPESRAYVYPDIVVAPFDGPCEDEEEDTLLDPILVVEVLSPRSERHDRGRKADAYRSIETLREYVPVAQDAARVEVYRRGAGGAWSCHVAASLDDEVELESVGCVLRLADVYERVLPPRG